VKSSGILPDLIVSTTFPSMIFIQRDQLTSDRP
jgi:hypothetical protein